MSKGKTEPDEDGQQVRIQLQVSEVASPELYADLIAIKVKSRRYRLTHLATLGLLLERSLLQGGSGNAGGLAHSISLAPSSVQIQAPKKQLKSKVGAAQQDGGNNKTLDVPSGFGDALVGEFST